MAAATSAEGLWGFAKWTSLAVVQMGGVSPLYSPDLSMRESTTDKAISHMVSQYARAMRAFVAVHGREKLDSLISEAIESE